MSMWMSADPAGSRLIDPNRRGFHFIESLNWYSYAENNPIKYRDPNGKDATAVLEFAQQAAEWSGNFAMNDSPALGPCDVVAAGGLIVAGVAGIIGGLWAIGEWIDSQTKARVEPKVIPRERPRNVSIHHIATDKNSISAKTGGPWTPRFQTLFAKGGLTLNIPQNKVPVENHAGPHPEAYHQLVYQTIDSTITLATNGMKEGTPEYIAAAKGAILTSLTALGMQCQTPGTPLNLMITKG